MIRFYVVPSSVMGVLILWFTFEYNRPLFLSIQTILTIHNFPTSAPWTQKLFLVLGPSLSFDFLSSRKFFLKLIFFSWFPLPFSFFFPTALFWDWVLGGTTQLHPNRDQELMFFLSQETLSILCKLTTSSSPRTSFTEQNTPVFSGSGGLWLMKSESFLF